LAGLLTGLCKDAGISTTTLPEGLRRRESQNHVFWFNYNAEPVTHGDISIPAADVLWQAK
jgi:hypothetical protein